MDGLISQLWDALAVMFVVVGFYRLMKAIYR
jgi:hypothetical protein